MASIKYRKPEYYESFHNPFTEFIWLYQVYKTLRPIVHGNVRLKFKTFTKIAFASRFLRIAQNLVESACIVRISSYAVERSCERG